jgi:chemotaxis protein histidine kinase CheA
MSKEQPGEVFMPPNMLKAKVGGTVSGLDSAAIQRAEAAMDTLKVEFSDWITKDIAQLNEANDSFQQKRDAETGGELYRASHDLKGQATTFEYPLIARVASSLGKLMEELKSPEQVPLPLVQAHVDAIRVIFRDKIKDISTRTALILVEELENRTRQTLERALHAG